jgi:hypothetical protein
MILPDVPAKGPNRMTRNNSFKVSLPGKTNEFKAEANKAYFRRGK